MDIIILMKSGHLDGKQLHILAEKLIKKSKKLSLDLKTFSGGLKEVRSVCSSVTCIEERNAAHEKIRKIPTFSEEFVFYSSVIPSLGLKKEYFDAFPTSGAKKLELSKLVTKWINNTKLKCNDGLSGGSIKVLKRCRGKTRPDLVINAIKNRISLNKKAKRTPTINQDIAFYSIILTDSELVRIVSLSKSEKRKELSILVEKWIAKNKNCSINKPVSGGMTLFKTEDYYKDLCAKLKALVDRLERVSKTGMSSFEADFAFYSTFIKGISMDTFKDKSEIEKIGMLGDIVRKWIDKHSSECKKYLDKQGKKLDISPRRKNLENIPERKNLETPVERSKSSESLYASRETLFDENDLY